jgi:hypothetical protein
MIEIRGLEYGLDTKLRVCIGSHPAPSEMNCKLSVVAVRGLLKIVVLAEHHGGLKVACVLHCGNIVPISEGANGVNLGADPTVGTSAEAEVQRA